ncbi:MAG TPA: ATP-binding protein [Candidatus Binatia bacterium]|nr:ATP-binding protein [Candidatus Binatia bacterium]
MRLKSQQTSPAMTRHRRFSVPVSIVAMFALATAAFVYAASCEEYRLQAWTLLAAGLSFAALFGALLLVLTRRTAFVEGVSQQRTAGLAREAAERARAAERLCRSEEALRSSDERWRMLADQSSDFLARHQMDGVLTYASPVCRSLFGYEPEEMVGKSYFEFFEPADVERVREKIRAAAAEPGIATVGYRVRRNDSSSISLETRLRVLHDPVTQAPSEVLTASRDVSERTRIEGLRQDLLGMLSHDLKNPLTAVLGFAEILREMPPDDPQRDEFLARIEANAYSALGLATNFVDASRIQSGTLAPTLEPVFLNELIERVLRNQESRARMKQIRLEAHLDRSGPMALLDPRLIDRVVANLVNNAIKFSPTKSSVRVETAVQNGSVVVRVQDQGPGIPADQRATLFQHLGEMASLRTDSSSLALFIVKTLVDAQGGTVGAKFPPEGGTIFEIVFPAGGEPP